eukprot:333718_1
MSKGFGKKALLYNKKGSKSNSNCGTPSKNNNTNDSEDDNKLMVKFVFEGEKFHARTPIMFEQLSLDDLLKKLTLDITLPPPSANELFETYFKEDIYPYIRHNIQSQIRNKRDITKLWDLQSIILQKIYEERAELLRVEWTKLRKQNTNALKMDNNNLQTDDLSQELLRKKAQLKAKNKANKQKWKDQIAMQIASGQFDEPQIKKQPKEDNNKSYRKKKKDQKKNKSKTSKPNKQIKKKKVKKWKDKKTKKQPEWPGIVNKQIPITNTVYNNKKSAAEQLKENYQKLAEQNNGNNNKDKKLILSELKYKIIIRSEHNEYIMDNENNNDKQIELIKNGMEVKGDLLVGIKIWLYMCEMNSKIENDKDEIWLNTNKNEVLLSINHVKLFEVLWSDFGMGINRKIDENNINVVFVKKTKILRVKIPILSV